MLKIIDMRISDLDLISNCLETNFDDLEEPVFLGKWNKKTTKELALELHKGEATINRYLDSALLKVKDAYDKNLIKM